MAGSKKIKGLGWDKLKGKGFGILNSVNVTGGGCYGEGVGQGRAIGM